MDEDDADAEGAQHRDIDEDIGKVLVGDDSAIDGDDEDLLPEAGHVLEDAAKVGGFHCCVMLAVSVCVCSRGITRVLQVRFNTKMRESNLLVGMIGCCWAYFLVVRRVRVVGGTGVLPCWMEKAGEFPALSCPG